MLTRRRFLNLSGMGITVFSAGCYPPLRPQSAQGGTLQQTLALAPQNKKRLLGYPINMNDPAPDFFEWRNRLFESGVNAFAFNNVGNPFNKSPIPFNTHNFERDTILSFAKLLSFPHNDTWGFISNSGTDSNMHGMYLGRTLLKARTGVLPKAYFTREAHYSVQILRDLLGLETVFVKTLPDNSMDPEDLALKLADSPNQPALVVATLGTTFKGAIDNLDKIRKKLRGLESYLHLDAALFGGYLPYTKYASLVSHQNRMTESSRYDSVAVSCHKFFGFPSPAGLFVTRQSLYDEFNEHFSRIHDPEYIHQVPGTITCSRDAVKPAEFYYFTTEKARAKQTEDTQVMLKNTDYLMGEFQAHFPELMATRSNPMSNTIYFRYPGNSIVNKYSLATMHMKVDNKSERFAHAIVMPHVSRDVLAEFLTDLERRHHQ